MLLTSPLINNVGIFVPKEMLIIACVEMPIFLHFYFTNNYFYIKVHYKEET